MGVDDSGDDVGTITVSDGVGIALEVGGSVAVTYSGYLVSFYENPSADGFSFVDQNGVVKQSGAHCLL